jgi:GMP synthase (glutamine-hydrolysing)
MIPSTADKEPLRPLGTIRALVIEHAEHEGVGLLGDALHVRRAGVDRRRVHRGEALPDGVAGYNVVIVMGGSQSAWDDARSPTMAREAALLAEAARAGLVTLGVCLGAQLLARGLGARVYKGDAPELGVGPIALTDEGRADALIRPFDGKDVLHWHGDTFDLPDGAVHLATSSRYANQAFRFGERAWGLQFHVECDAPMRRQWAKLGEHELRAAGVAPTSLAAAGTAGIDERGRAFAAALMRLV